MFILSSRVIFVNPPPANVSLANLKHHVTSFDPTLSIIRITRPVDVISGASIVT